MAKVEFTKLSSKGQVVIPKKLRFGLGEGTLFAVSRKDDLIILKRVETDLEKFRRLTKKFEKIAKKIKLKPDDIPKIIHKIRGVKD